MDVKDQIAWAEKMRTTSTGDRYNTGKTRWSLVSWKALVPMVEVLEFGAKKYAPFNWHERFKIYRNM
jgi:hypothetical protein